MGGCEACDKLAEMLGEENHPSGCWNNDETQMDEGKAVHDLLKQAYAELAALRSRVGKLEAGVSAAWWEIRAILPSKDRPDFVAGATWANAVLETNVRSLTHHDWYRIRDVRKPEALLAEKGGGG